MKSFPRMCYAASLILTLSVTGKDCLAQERSLLQMLAEFVGLTADPSAMRGSRAGPPKGEIWIADLQTNMTVPFASDYDYQSPIFLPNGDILALVDNIIVRLSSEGGQPSALFKVEGIKKLVGASKNAPDRILALQTSDAGPMPVIISLSQGTLSPVGIKDLKEDASSLAYLSGWNREYDDATLVVRPVKGGGGQVWTDVFIVKEDQQPVNVSNCDGAYCGQPSLAFDGRRVAFVHE